MRNTRVIQGLSPSEGLICSPPRRDRRVVPFGMYLPTRARLFEHRAESILVADNAGIASWPAFSIPYANPTGVSGSGDWSATQSTGANQPVCKTNIIAGYPVARFDGNRFWNIPNTGSAMSKFSYFAVMKCTDGNPRTLFAGAAGSAQVRINGNKIELLHATISLLGASTTAMSTSLFYTIGVTYDSSLASNNLRFYLNGAADGVVSVTTGLSVGNTLIGQRTGGEPFLGDLVHDAFYFDVVTSLEREWTFHVFRSLYNHY